MKNILLLLLLVPFSNSLFSQTEKLSLDKGWRFYLGDIPMPVIKGHGMSYGNAKAGKAWGAAAPEYDDTEWRLLNLPHDWAVEQLYDSTENLSQGYRKRGFGWYRRNFKVQGNDRGKKLELQFDGIATHATIWFNGTIVHRNFCGYTSMYIDITPFVKYGDELNTIVVRIDAVQQEGWWYEGAGIYRHTWLVKKNALHVIADGVYANPIKQQTNWLIPVEVSLENIGKANASAEVEAILYDEKGSVVSQNKTTAIVTPLHQSIAKISLAVNNPTLWFTHNPVLYKVKTIVRQNGNLVDEVNTTCGFRTIKFTADSGFYLNDVYTKIKGTCNHQDHAGVGVAVPESLWEFRIRKLKEMGSNAYRCAHNPPAKEFLDACDKLGLMVMDENRNFNTSDEYQRQLEWLVKRDRNHPSIILWSVFNEETTQGTEMGYEMVRRMSSVVKNLDTTRPVTAAMSGGQFTSINVSKAVDIVGFNYRHGDYDRFHKENPLMPMTSSEDVSGLMQRDIYKTDRKKHTLAAYDEEKPSWGNLHRNSWKMIDERKFLAGCFVWTGFDYRGEPTPYEWPTASSNFGIMDACGFPKSIYYYYQSQWLPDKNILFVMPHWNWPQDSVGKNIKVMAFTNADKIKLSLNGKTISEQAVDKYMSNTWQVPYQPGTLEATGYKNGKEVSRYKVETTGEPVALQLLPDRNTINGNGVDAVPVTVQAVDAKGRVVRTVNIPILFEATGEGKLIGHGNGDPNTHEPEQTNTRSLYNGLAQAILQSNQNANGTLTLTAKSGNLKSATVTINVKAVEQIPFVAMEAMVYNVSGGWRLSPFYNVKPDANIELADSDMNSWLPSRTNQLQDFKDGTFVIYRTTFKPYAQQRNEGGKLVLKDVSGKAEVWLDKKLVATKTSMEKEDIVVDIPPSSGDRKISVMIEAEKGTKAGLGGLVQVKAK